MSKDTKGQVESILTELGKKIDQLITETKGASSDVKKDLDKKIKDLKKKKEKIEADFEEYKENNGDKWKDARIHILAAMQELKLAIESVFKDKKA